MHLVRYLQLICGFKRKRKGISANHHSVRERPHLIPLCSAISSSVATLKFKFIPKDRQTLTCSRCTFLTFQISSTWLHENMVFSYRFVHNPRSWQNPTEFIQEGLTLKDWKEACEWQCLSLFCHFKDNNKAALSLCLQHMLLILAMNHIGVLAAEKGAWRKAVMCLHANELGKVTSWNSHPISLISTEFSTRYVFYSCRCFPLFSVAFCSWIHDNCLEFKHSTAETTASPTQ